MKKKYSGKDIDVFVFTYNRKNLLVETLKSLINQNTPGVRITILDNASTDGTSDICVNYLQTGIRYERAEVNLGWQGNFERAKKLSSRDWTLLFHDDDLLHPEYLEWALAEINSRPKLVLLGSSLSFETSPNHIWPAIHPFKNLHCEHARDLAALMYSGFPLCFPGIIYQTQVLKKKKLKSCLYGKIADRPLLLDMVSDGSATIANFPFVKYRQHEGQDSKSAGSGPFVSQLGQLHNTYYKLLGINPLNKYGRCFLTNSLQLFKYEFNNLDILDKEKFNSFRKYRDFVLTTCEIKHGLRFFYILQSIFFGIIINPFKKIRQIVGKIKFQIKKWLAY